MARVRRPIPDDVFDEEYLSEIGCDLMIVDINGREKPINLTKSENINEYLPKWSPDGSKIFYIEMPS